MEKMTAYHSRRDTWIADQEIAIWRPRYSHEGGHYEFAALVPPWARSYMVGATVAASCFDGWSAVLTFSMRLQGS